MQLQLWENQMSLDRWQRYKRVEAEILREIDLEHQLSQGRYLRGEIDVDEDSGDLVRANPINSWSFPFA
jgi:hypothetical protein